MNWMTVPFAALLLAGCSKASMPDLEDVPPTAQASANAQASGEAQASGTERASGDTQAAVSTAFIELTPEQRSDIEHGVRRGLADSNSADFGTMTARISRFTTESYIVCGWVKPRGYAGYEPFLAMYVPKMKIALLIGVGSTQPRATIRQRCVAEGVPLDS